MLFISDYESPLGKMTILTSNEVLLGIWFEGQDYYGAHYQLEQAQRQNNTSIQTVKKWLSAYFSGEKPAIDSLTLAPEVTAFREKVLAILTKIPYGETMSYQEIVNQLREEHGGNIGSARAVGGAVGHNPISVIIPCHRVVGNDGSLTGYAGGINRKVALLELEGWKKS